MKLIGPQLNCEKNKKEKKKKKFNGPNLGCRNVFGVVKSIDWLKINIELGIFLVEQKQHENKLKKENK